MDNSSPAGSAAWIVLVTGVSGSGKSAVARQISAAGYRAISLDGHPGLCTWVNTGGQEVERPSHPTLEWLDSHDWVMRVPVLDELIASLRREPAPAWLTGIAANTAAMASRFDTRVLLRIDRPTMLARLDNPSRGNDFGRIGQTRQLLLDRFDNIQNRLARICDTQVDARTPLPDVAADVVRAGMRTR